MNGSGFLSEMAGTSPAMTLLLMGSGLARALRAPE
jgi:hypothetical protein